MLCNKVWFKHAKVSEGMKQPCIGRF